MAGMDESGRSNQAVIGQEKANYDRVVLTTTLRLRSSCVSYDSIYGHMVSGAGHLRLDYVEGASPGADSPRMSQSTCT